MCVQCSHDKNYDGKEITFGYYPPHNHWHMSSDEPDRPWEVEYCPWCGEELPKQDVH